jgi:DNA transposition AAA+ family ATPase
MHIRAELKDLMERRNLSIGYVSTATGVAKSTISMWINDNYNGKNEKISDIINNFIQREKERTPDDELPIVDISIVKYISEIGRLCHTKGKIGVCAGRAGLGKTVAVKQYTRNYLDSILIESDSGYTAKSLLLEIHKRLGLSGKGSAYDLMS